MNAQKSTVILILLAFRLATGAGQERSARLSELRAEEPKLWALLVAGSHIYDNYRHQADVCHAYHLLRNHGIPDERIVVMMYDDIANSTYNPTPGVIINHPNGSNVYPGVPKDYTRKLVTSQNFLDVLQGKKVKGGSGKVIASGPNDHVFVNFADHGAPGLIAFPHDELHARPFVNVIKKMHEEKKFAKMVIYIEACESGSMFDGLLPNNVNVYATTAANPHESSYACYYDKLRETYLGDFYSVRWMEDSDREDLHKETLLDQFQIVKNETTTSHVMEYGDLSIGKLSLSEFQGAKNAKPIVLPEVPCDPVSSRDVPIAVLRNKLKDASNPAARRSIKHRLQSALRKRYILQKKVAEIVRIVSENNKESTEGLLSEKRPLRDFDCYELAVRHFNDNCFNLSRNPYALGYLYVLVNMCEAGYDVGDITGAMNVTCTHKAVVDIV
uniref:legumain n=1 Tax=Haemaphysalis longicornis TaxID=44386 RepID=A9CQC1_HAELO|nr:2nd tick legumain [Haemaphysalis longicornis]